MKHGKREKKLSRKRDQRRALLRIMAADLILKEKIVTTEAKAKALRPVVEKMITKSRGITLGDQQKVSGKDGENLSIIRQLSRFLPERAWKKLVREVGSRYRARPGGYTRISKLPPRQKDGAKRAIIELVKDNS